uniref:Uncharacterized protein n=1 Tax=Physcomitrium patens TaxID=3218 RepID=A0A2K1IDL5_PHYPA|nr:hypothetical protein PHYPA_029516 [Physcomitrium patens]
MLVFTRRISEFRIVCLTKSVRMMKTTVKAAYVMTAVMSLGLRPNKASLETKASRKMTGKLTSVMHAPLQGHAPPRRISHHTVCTKFPSSHVPMIGSICPAFMLDLLSRGFLRGLLHESFMIF